MYVECKLRELEEVDARRDDDHAPLSEAHRANDAGHVTQSRLLDLCSKAFALELG